MNADIFNAVIARAEREDHQLQTEFEKVLAEMRRMPADERAEDEAEEMREQMMALVRRQAAFGARVVLAWKDLDRGAEHHTKS
jgi:hypothetical protein